MSEQDQSFMRTLIMVMVGLFVFMLIIIFLARGITGTDGSASVSDDPRQAAKVEQNIKPVGMVNIAGEQQIAAAGSGQTVTSSSAAPTTASADGQGTYQAACFACHGTGAAGAPKLGDKGAWSARIAQGTATLYSNAINGVNAMPPKGGRADLSDEAVKAAVDYLVSQSK